MNLDQLQAFLMVAETSHITQVAEKLNISQPTLSVSIKNLETEIGAPLFRRQNRKLILTKYGETFHHAALSVVSTLESSIAQIREMKAIDDNNVSMISPALYNYPGLLDRIYRTCPNIHIRMLSNVANNFHPASFSQTNDGELPDLVITSYNMDVPNYRKQLLRTYPMVLAVASTHPLAGKESVSIADLAHERFVCKTAQYGSTQLFIKSCKEAGFEPDIVFESDSSHDQLEVVSCEQAVALMSNTQNNYKLMQTIPNITRINISGLDPMPLILYRRSDIKPRNIAWVLSEILAEYFSVCSDDPPQA